MVLQKGDRTTIKISDKLWRYLTKIKERGQTYEELIWEIIDRARRDS